MTRVRNRLAVLFSVLLFSVNAGAAIESHQFDTPEQEAHYEKLIKELRCLVCQNQNLADSNADLAKDLRRQTYEQVKQGKTEDEVIDYMVARYGDFVRYKPAFKPLTWALWIGPFVILLAGFLTLVRFIRSRSAEPVEKIDEEKLKKARELLGDN